MQELLDTIGDVFTNLRLESGMTQRQVAKIAGCTQAKVSDLENARSDVFISTIHKIASAYGYDIEIHFVKAQDEFDSVLSDFIREEGSAEVSESGDRIDHPGESAD